MFKLHSAGKERGDCTTPYHVELDKTYTVNEFIHTVLTKKKREWGYIGIYCSGKIFGEPVCEYKYGKLPCTLPDDVLDKKIVKAEADGGWSRMDYLLWVE